MRTGIVRAVILITVCMAFCAQRQAAAAPADAAPPRYLLFSGADVWSYGGFAHAGILWSPDGLEQTGFTFKMLAGTGSYRYASGALGGTEVTGEQWLGSLLPGWRFKGQGIEMTLFAGLDVQSHRFRPDDTANSLHGLHTGLRVGVDLWYEPIPSAMLAASVSGSTVGPSYWSRVAAGWRVFDRVWIGPEILAMGDENYRQFQLGVHITALRFGAFEWTLGAGWSTDSDGRDSAYGRIGVLTRL